MNIERLLGSKTKTDILKYLIFRRQWISMRAMESDMNRSFPAIKKQVDILLDAWILKIDKDSSWWAIYIKQDIFAIIKSIFIYSLKKNIKDLFTQHEITVNKYFLWKVFDYAIDLDLVLIYNPVEDIFLNEIKKDISNIFEIYFIRTVNVSFMSKNDYEKRYRLADKFVLNLITKWKEWKLKN
jgi:hypothetical protein